MIPLALSGCVSQRGHLCYEHQPHDIEIVSEKYSVELSKYVASSKFFDIAFLNYAHRHIFLRYESVISRIHVQSAGTPCLGPYSSVAPFPIVEYQSPGSSNVLSLSLATLNSVQHKVCHRYHVLISFICYREGRSKKAVRKAKASVFRPRPRFEVKMCTAMENSTKSC